MFCTMRGCKMLRFSTTDVLENKMAGPLLGKDDFPEEIQFLLNEFVNKLTRISSCKILQGSELKIEESIKTIILKDIEEAKSASPRSLDEILNEFKQGKYDECIFGAVPQKTKELETIIREANRDFIQRLFLNCSSDEQLAFWLEAGAKMPKDALALAILLGNNIHILKHLEKQGALENLSNEDKKQLLIRANRFDNQGLEFLKQEFGFGLSNQENLRKTFK